MPNREIRLLAYAVLAAGGAIAIGVSETAEANNAKIGPVVGLILLAVGGIGFIRRLIIDRRNDRQNQRPDGGTP